MADKPPPFLNVTHSDKYARKKTPLPPAAELLDMVEAGMTYSEIAGRYGCSSSTVGQRLADSGLLDRKRHPAVGTPLRRMLVWEDQDWVDDALCAQTDPEAFFPEKGGSTRPAKTTCRQCSVREKCLQYALDNDEKFGVWGGLSERERRKLKRPS